MIPMVCRLCGQSILLVANEVTCDACRGGGTDGDQPCEQCEGNGVEMLSKPVCGCDDETDFDRNACPGCGGNCVTACR